MIFPHPPRRLNTSDSAAAAWHSTIKPMPQHPDRHVPLQGATNFRDLGGYPGHGSRPLRWRKLFRSDHLAGLTDADRAVLAALGLARTIDFRGVAERAATPYRLPGVVQHSLVIEPSVVQRMQDLVAAGRELSAAVAVELMKDLYRGTVNDHSHCFAEMFDLLLQADIPSVLHCTAGKDRTGVGSALILLALGVPRELVLQDYLLTNQFYRHPPVPASETPAEALAVLWRVQQSFLEAALHAVDNEQGGVDVYLRQRLGLSSAALETLATRYLQGA